MPHLSLFWVLNLQMTECLAKEIAYKEHIKAWRNQEFRSLVVEGTCAKVGAIELWDDQGAILVQRQWWDWALGKPILLADMLNFNQCPLPPLSFLFILFWSSRKGNVVSHHQ